MEPSARLARTSGAAVACRQRPPSIQEAYVYIMSVGELVAPRAALQAVLAINLLGLRARFLATAYESRDARGTFAPYTTHLTVTH